VTLPRILFSAIFTVITCLALGLLLFEGLGIRLKRLEHELLAGITGSALLSSFVFLLCTVHVARLPVFLAAGVMSLSAAAWMVWRDPKKREGLPPLPRFWQYLFLASFAVYALVYLSNSLAPEHSPDGSSYHLGLVARYLRQHGFVRITSNLYASLSQGVEMLFLFAFAFGRHSAAATVHCCFLFTLPLLMVSYTRRIGHPRAGVTAALLVYLSPVVGIDGVSAYNDVALATVAFAMFYLLQIWRERDDDRLMIPIGLLAGFCFAIKYPGFVATLYMLTVILMARRKRGFFLRAMISSGAAATMALPWLLKNWYFVDNPFSPFLNRVFLNPWVHITFEDNWRAILTHWLLPSLQPLFWIVTVTGQTGGQLGPVFLLAPLALLSLRNPLGRRCLLAALFFLATYPQNIGTRFLIPGLPFVALALCYALEFSAPLLTACVAAALLLGWPRVIDKYRAPAGSWQIEHIPWQVALQIDSPIAFLEQRWSGYNLARKINDTVPETKVLWSTTGLPEAWMTREVLVNYYSAQGEKIEDLLQTPIIQDLQPLWQHRYTFTTRSLSHIRILQIGTGQREAWSIGEVRFFNGEQEVNPAHAEAKPFPWDIRYAFDHNPVTRWHTWEPLRPNQYVDVFFENSVPLDRIEIYCAHDQWNMKMRLEGSALETDARLETSHLQPAGDLRLPATRTIKALGIDYLLIGKDYVTSADMHADPARWGLRERADTSAGKIYQIQ
jgi:hypothetical protein